TRDDAPQAADRPRRGAHTRPRSRGPLTACVSADWKRPAAGARMRLLWGVAVLSAGIGCAPLRGAPARPPPPRLLEFEATAYSVTGTTASGMQTRRGIVAADPTVLPIGSRIRVHGAGAYSGAYMVMDT